MTSRGGCNPAQPTVTVVTPWRDHVELAPAYWSAIDAGGPERVLIVDNASTPPLYGTVVPKAGDGPASRLDLRLEENAGYSRASNVGWRVAARMPDPTDAVVFLNNDVALGDPGWLDSIRRELRRGRLVGAELRIDAHTDVDGRRLAYLDGWCVAAMLPDLVALDGFDEGYEEPSYFGDNDLCLRAKARGMRLVQAETRLRHIGGATRRDLDVATVDAITIRNRERFAARARELRAAA